MSKIQTTVHLYGPEAVIDCDACDSTDTVGEIHKDGVRLRDMCMDCFFDLYADRINMPVTFSGPEADDIALQFQDVRLQYECDACTL